jgi:6-phosphogluconolactonase
VSAGPPVRRTLFVGSFTPAKGSTGEGLTTVEVETATGGLRTVGLAGGGCPAFLVQHPDLDLLYAASELPNGTIDTYSIADDGTTEWIGSVTTGASPAHIAIGRVGTSLMVVTSHYYGGCFAVHRVDADGVVGPCLDLVDRNAPAADGSRKPESRAHSAVFDPRGRFVLAADLGQDEVVTYGVDEQSGTLTELTHAKTPTGSGPRHLAWHPDGRLFVAGELGAVIMTFQLEPETGRLTWVGERASLAHPGDFSLQPEPAEIALSHGGRFLHIANRNADVVSTFATEGGDGLRPVSDVPTGGQTPRHFAVVDDELYLGNQASDTVRSFTIDPESGEVAWTGEELQVVNPAALLLRRN